MSQAESQAREDAHGEAEWQRRETWPDLWRFARADRQRMIRLLMLMGMCAVMVLLLAVLAVEILAIIAQVFGVFAAARVAWWAVRKVVRAHWRRDDEG